MRQLSETVFQKLGATSREERKALLVQFIKFGLVGVSNTFVSWACYYAVLWLDEDLYMLGSILGTIVSIANAFIWNDRLVFKGNDRRWKSRLIRLGKTYVSYGGTSLLSNALLWAEVAVFSVSKTIAPIFNLLLTIPLNFAINRLWTFKNHDGKIKEPEASRRGA